MEIKSYKEFANMGLAKHIVVKIHHLLNNDKALEELLSSISYSNPSKAKKYQVVIFNARFGQFGVIVENQHQVINIFENKNYNLGKLLMECDISFKKKGGERVDAYKYPRIGFQTIGEKTPNRLSLGALYLLASGVDPTQLKEPHHDLHASINTSGNVKNLSRAEHARQSAKFNKNCQVYEYFKEAILCTHEVGLNRFERNIRLITKKYIKHRGITVVDLDLLNIDLSVNMLDRKMFELSNL